MTAIQSQPISKLASPIPALSLKRHMPRSQFIALSLCENSRRLGQRGGAHSPQHGEGGDVAKRRGSSPRLMAEMSSKRARIAKIEALIEKLDYLMSHAAGLRYFSYKLRKHKALLAIRAIKRTMRSKRKKNGRTPFVVNPKGVQGGSPGLVQQK